MTGHSTTNHAQKPDPFCKTSVIILNWNKKEMLKECLKSLEKQTFKDFEVIVVDNGSTDGSVELIKEEFSNFVKLIENKQNLGFAKGNNMGIEMARGKYIMTLNNDTRLARDCIERLVESADASRGDIGMWAPKILSIEPPHLVDSVGGLLISMDGIGKGRGRLEVDGGNYDSIKEILLPSGCAALYRKDMFRDIGLFDDDFFAYCEDTDVGLRARLMGWKAISVPQAVVYHAYSATGEKYSPFKAFLVERNHLWVAIKNFPLRTLALFPLYSLWRYLVQVYGIIARRGAGGRFLNKASASTLLYILIKSYFSALVRLPSVLRKRRNIQRRRRISSMEVVRLLKAHNIRVKDLVLMD